MFDTVTGKFELGPYSPKDESRNSWETRSRDFFDSKLGARMTSTTHTLSRKEARVAIYGDGGVLNVEASLPKLLYGNNLMTVTHAEKALRRLREFVSDYVTGDIPDFGEMDYLRADYCHNFRLGSALPDYVHTLSNVSFLKHRRTTDGNGGVEWWSENGRRIRAYDKHKEILEKDEKEVAEARGILRFEIELRKKTRFLERRLGAQPSQKSRFLPERPLSKKLKLQDVLRPEIAYCCLVETLNAMCLGLGFQAQDAARQILDQNFSFRKSTRLLGLLRRFETESIEDIKRVCSRSSLYSDKRDLRGLALWPPSAGPVSLPALEMPSLETVLSAEGILCDPVGTEEEQTHANAI
jgi:hypothetical protein